MNGFFNNLKRTITLLTYNQTLVLNIPKQSLKGEKYIIPTIVNKLQGDKFIINYCEKDEGPITKLLPSLRNKKINDNDIIIVCDDDIVYKEDTFKLLEEGVKHSPDKIATMCFEIIMGYKGFAFIKKLLKGLLNIKIQKTCIRLDDTVIGWYVEKNKIEINLISNNDDNDDNYGFCNIYLTETDTHPKWEELNKDDRPPMIKDCLKDLLKPSILPSCFTTTHVENGE